MVNAECTFRREQKVGLYNLKLVLTLERGFPLDFFLHDNDDINCSG